MAEKPATRTRSTSRTTRPRAAAKPKTPPVEDEAAAPPLVFESRKNRPAEKRIPLFSIDGEVFTVPAEPSPAIGIRFLAASRNGNPFAAGFQLIEDMIGVEAFARFMAWDDLSDDYVSQVVQQCSTRALGGPEAAAKN